MVMLMVRVTVMDGSQKQLHCLRTLVEGALAGLVRNHDAIRGTEGRLQVPRRSRGSAHAGGPAAHGQDRPPPLLFPLHRDGASLRLGTTF